MLKILLIPGPIIFNVIIEEYEYIFSDFKDFKFIETVKYDNIIQFTKKLTKEKLMFDRFNRCHHRNTMKNCNRLRNAHKDPVRRALRAHLY